MTNRPAHELRFGAFVLDLSRSALLHEQQPVPLRRQTFETLRYLVEHSGRVVSKTDLVQAVWTSPPADPDGSVVQCIKEIRKALGTDERWMIRTVPGVGYECKAAVHALDPSEEASAPRPEQEAARKAQDIGFAERIGGIARRPPLTSVIALAAGAVLTISIVLVWSAGFSISQRDPLEESYRYKPLGDIHTGATVAIRTDDGRMMTCVGGEGHRTPRRCWWN